MIYYRKTLFGRGPKLTAVQDHLLESVIHYYESLREVGTYQDSAESAAKMAIIIWDHVSEWWGCDDVQRDREVFCERYSRSNSTPIYTLSELLKKASTTL